MATNTIRFEKQGTKIANNKWNFTSGKEILRKVVHSCLIILSQSRTRRTRVLLRYWLTRREDLLSCLLCWSKSFCPPILIYTKCLF